jgi:hypothetical protein
MNGNSPEKRLSGLSLNLDITYILEAFLLIMAGGLAAYMHFHVRLPLNMPGHHGLEFMAILALVRLSSRFRYAGMISMIGTGIVLLVPGLGGGTLLHGFAYLLPGIILDLVYGAGKERMRMLFVIAFFSGIAYMAIPLSRMILNALTGYPYMAFVKHGMIYTIFSFFFFGMMGGLLGYGLNTIRDIFSKPKNN